LMANLQGLVDEIEVRVEKLEGIHLVEDFTDHSSFAFSSTSNLKNLMISEKGLPQEWSCGGAMSFDFTKARASNLSLSKTIELQGQPDTLLLTLNPGGIATKSLLIHLSNQKESRAWSYNIDIPKGVETTTLRIPLLNPNGEKLGFDEYPLSFEKLYFMLDDTAMSNGAYNILWHDMKAKYGEDNQEVSIPSRPNVQGLVLLSNPVSDELSIKFDVYKQSEITLYIYTLTGKLSKIVELGQFSGGTYHERIGVSELVNGTYLLHINSYDSYKSMKFIKN
ncbi:MAG: T9SS type A sorting domain-containing protein, partial [Bacteroidales bacterium]